MNTDLLFPSCQQAVTKHPTHDTANSRKPDDHFTDWYLWKIESPTYMYLNWRQQIENNYLCSVNVLKKKTLVDTWRLCDHKHISQFSSHCCCAAAVTLCTLESSAAAAACFLSAPPWWCCRCCGRPGRSPRRCWPSRRWSPPRCLQDACRLWNRYVRSDWWWWVCDPLCTSYSEITLLPVGWWSCDHSVDQDAVCHVWEGGVPQLQLCNDAGAEGWGRSVLVIVVEGLLWSDWTRLLRVPYLPRRQCQHHNTNVAPLCLRFAKPRTFSVIQNTQDVQKGLLSESNSWHCDQQFPVAALTLLFRGLIEKNSQMVGRNSEGDSRSDLHGVYSNDFTILMSADTDASLSREPRQCAR